MAIQVRPATDFDDVCAVIGPKRPDASVCFCLSYRIPSTENNALRGLARGERVRQLLQEDVPPGVLAYETGTDGERVVGWAAVHPRAATTFARNRRIPQVDDLPVWSLWCLRVRPGHRGSGITGHLIRGAVAFARDRGAPAVEAYPVDNGDSRVDLTMAYVGTRAMFARAGFVEASGTTSVLNAFPRILMRLDLS